MLLQVAELLKLFGFSIFEECRVEPVGFLTVGEAGTLNTVIGTGSVSGVKELGSL